LGEIQLADLISLTDDAPFTGNVNQTILNQVISNASGEIDFYVGSRYSVPFSPTPPSVESMAIVLTCYRLYRRREVPDEKNKYTEDRQEIIKFLQKVKAGDEALDLSVSQEFSPVQSVQRATIYGWGSSFVPNSM
jgi:phage gp36-like protein